MSTDLVAEIAAKVAQLPPERQREALALIEQLAARPARSYLPRAARQLKGATAHGPSIGEEEIRQARREMWQGYLSENEG